MKNQHSIAIVVTIMMVSTFHSVLAETTVTVVDRPVANSSNRHYPGNRKPLLPSVLVKLPPGCVRPEGWLRETMHRQRDGLVGRLPEVSAWLQKEGNAWLSNDGRGKWGWEEVPYWLRGFLCMARQLDDKAMEKEALVWIEAVLAGERSDGNFGPLRVFGDDDSQDHWGNMLMLSCLQEYFDYSHDKRVLQLMSNYFRLQSTIPDEKFLTHFWQYYRGGDNLQSVYWLYNRTGDAWLLDLARKVHRNTANWRLKDDLPNWHGVNIAEGFNEPAVYYLQSHDPADLAAARRNFDFIRDRFGQMPGGMFAADENARGGYTDPRQGIETCAVIEQILSDQFMLRTTGDAFWADHLEDVALNTLPATMMPDCRSLRYITSPNLVRSDRQSYAPGIENMGPMFAMNPLSHRCCQHNYASSWTSVVQSLWTATADNGLCACVYGPSVVKALVADGMTATIRESTRYPFEEQVRFTIDVERPTKFPVYLRIPAWCSQSEFLVNEVPVADNLTPSKYVKIIRTWNAGDVVTMKLPMVVRQRRWKENHNSLSVERGPLTYSLRMGEKLVQCDPIATAAKDSQWREDVNTTNWPAFEIIPTSAWNYGLMLNENQPDQTFSVQQRDWPKDEYPFTAAATPIAMRCQARRISDWKLDMTGLCGKLQESPVYSDQPNETIELIPMGAAKLRLSVFPEVRDDKNLRTWMATDRNGISYKPTASFCNSSDDVAAVADGIEPCASNDRGIKRLSFLPHLGTNEWLQADFPEAKTLDQVAIYWCDDESRYDHAPTGEFTNLQPVGICRAPLNWQLLYLDDNGNWQPVQTSAPLGVETNQYNTVRFDRVTTKSLRIEVKLRDKVSTGVLEWNIGAARDTPGVGNN